MFDENVKKNIELEIKPFFQNYDVKKIVDLYEKVVFISMDSRDGVSFEIEEGSCVVIGGENGSGESLLMSIIAGLEEADSGSVKTFSKEVSLIPLEKTLSEET